MTLYVVRHKLTSDPDIPSSWMQTPQAASLDTKLTLTGLGSISYDVQVRACTQSHVCSPWSDTAADTPEPPPAPTGLRANGRGGDITLRWDKPDDSVAYYEVEYSELRCIRDRMVGVLVFEGITCDGESNYTTLSSKPGGSIRTTEVSVESGEKAIQVRFTPPANTGWNPSSYGSTDPLYRVYLYAVSASGERSGYTSVSVYPDIASTPNLLVHSISPLVPATVRTSGHLRYFICEDSIPAGLHSGPPPRSRTKANVVTDMKNAVAVWEENVRWWTGSRNIVTAHFAGTKTECSTPLDLRDIPDDPQILFTTEEKIRQFSYCDVDDVLGCYSRNTVMLVNVTPRNHWYHPYWATSDTYLHAMIGHEAGHAFGLWHSDEDLGFGDALMHPTPRISTLRDADIVAMMAHYQSR